jgi:Rod binding domain-containing protein
MTNAVPTLTRSSGIDPKSPAYLRLHQQARDLESVFLTTLTKEMFSTVKTDDQNFGGGFAEETWRGMQAEQFAGAIAEQGGIGLADQLMPTLLKLQEAAQSN